MAHRFPLYFSIYLILEKLLNSTKKKEKTCNAYINTTIKIPYAE